MTADVQTFGVLLMSYGGPERLEDVPAFVRDIRGGRPTPQPIIDAVTENYRRIGGRSPLLAITRRQAAALESALNAAAPPSLRYRVYVGMRHWQPRIAEVVAQMMDDGITQAVALPISPHYSKFNTTKYFDVLEAAFADCDVPFMCARVLGYHDHPQFVAAWAEQVRTALAELPAETHVVFSAHSLPVRAIEAGDPYAEQVRESARLIAEALALPAERWSVAFQSAGKTPEPWIGPELLDHLRALAEAGAPHVLVTPIGFVADHVEVLFDLDIQAREFAEELGLGFARTPSLNDDPRFIAALADVVRRHQGVAL